MELRAEQRHTHTIHTISAAVLAFVRRETVLAAATVLALVSALWVPPSASYLEYIDLRVLGILLSLMLVMAGFQKNGLFDRIGAALLARAGTTRRLVLNLVFLCFFSSMLITNDVALITFVPFAMLTLRRSGREEIMIPVIILQTLAANLGSMLTPIGNPQNLYLYHVMDISLGQFMAILLPATAVSGVLLLLCALAVGTWAEKKPGSALRADRSRMEPETHGDPIRSNWVYLGLFLCCLLVVLRVLPWPVAVVLVVGTVFLMDRSVFRQVDYSLLLTFVAFFIFTGNMGQLQPIRQLLQEVVVGRDLWAGLLTSQVISNVPATLLLSGFTGDHRALLLGVDLGGMGTLIASMASLISYKLYARAYDGQKGRYLGWFTLVNLGYLAVLLGVVLWTGSGLL